MRQCCKVMVNNSLIQPRGLSARHCRPSPAPRRRRKFIRDLRGALAECRTLLITLSVYCCVNLSSGPGTGGSEARLVRGFLCCKAWNRVKRWERVSVGQLTEAPGNSKNSTTFWGRLQKTLFPGNLDRREGTCLESAVDLLILKPS
jgi:hypothetical protein